MLTHLTPTGPYEGDIDPPHRVSTGLLTISHTTSSQVTPVPSVVLPTAAQQQESSLPFGLASLGISSDVMPSQNLFCASDPNSSPHACFHGKNFTH